MWFCVEIKWLNEERRLTKFFIFKRYSLIDKQPFLVFCNWVLNWLTLAFFGKQNTVLILPQSGEKFHNQPYESKHSRTWKKVVKKLITDLAAPDQENLYLSFLQLHLKNSETLLELIHHHRQIFAICDPW